MPLSLVWDSAREHFFRPESLERVALMRRFAVRKEQWFHAELMWLLDQLTNDRRVANWEPEHLTSDGKKVDFKIEVAGTSAAVEVKTAHCGQDKNRQDKRKPKVWKPCEYGGKYKNSECFVGVQQLGKMPPPRYLLVFAWPGLGENDHALTKHDWDEMLQSLQAACSENPGISFVRDPEGSPGGELSIGIFQIPLDSPATQG